ncbi:MAG: T9SS type A sorting domain-containing protein [Flavobacteriaceae bacterium]
MKYILLIIAPFLCYSQTVWTGPLMTFTKQNYDSPSSENSQDRITDLVWLTRGNRNVLYNAKTESSASAYSSPADTEWAEGNTNNLTGLVFSNFKSAAPQNNGSANILGMVGKNYVLHLITEDIYIDLKILSWQGGKSGGGFSYTRSTDPNLSTGFLKNIDIFLYPNPTTGLVRTNQDLIEQIRVYDLTGKQLIRSEDSSVDLSTFKNGVYLLQLYRSDTKDWVTKRLVKLE